MSTPVRRLDWPPLQVKLLRHRRPSDHVASECLVVVSVNLDRLAPVGPFDVDAMRRQPAFLGQDGVDQGHANGGRVGLV